MTQQQAAEKWRGPAGTRETLRLQLQIVVIMQKLKSLRMLEFLHQRSFLSARLSSVTMAC